MSKKKMIKNPLTKIIGTKDTNTLMIVRGSIWDKWEYKKSVFKRYIALKSTKTCIVGYKICLKRK